MVEAKDFARHWAGLVNAGEVEAVIALYAENAILTPTFARESSTTPAGVRGYFEMLGARAGLAVTMHEGTEHMVGLGDDRHVVTGIYSFHFEVDGVMTEIPSRYTFVVDMSADRPLMHHHSSQIPDV